MWWHTRRNQISSFGRNGRVHLDRHGASLQSTTGSRGVRINGSNAAYKNFRGSVKGTGYPLHSPVSPSLPLPCVTVCHHVSTGLYALSFLGDRQSTKKQNTHQLLYIYSIPPDDELQIYPRHVEVDWRNKLKINSASSWFSSHGCSFFPFSLCNTL